MQTMTKMNDILNIIPVESRLLALPKFFPTIPEEQRITYSENYVREQLETAFALTGLYANSDGEAAAHFLRCWSAYKNANYDNYARIIEAEADEYSLLYNYDKFTTGTETTSYGDADHPAESRTYTHGETVTRTDGQYVETTSNATYNGEEKETTKNQRGHSPNQHDTTEHTGDDTDTVQRGDVVRTPDLHEYGNVGVQTTADILLKEIMLRSTSMLYEYLAGFVRDYMNTVYPWRGEGCF